MITLREAFKLCEIQDSEVIWFREGKDARAIEYPMTGRNVRNKFDMRKTVVKRIVPRFFEYDFAGMMFIIERRK